VPQALYINGEVTNPEHFMITHFLILAKRTLLRNSLFSLVIVISLAIGLSVCYYSALFVYNELSYEAVHSKSERIVRLTIHIKSNHYDMKWARQDRDYMNALAVEIPEIETLIRFQNYYPRNVVVGNNAVKVTHGYSTDADVFNVFDFQLLKGNPEKALKKPNSVVLTESTAQKLFGNNTAYGETISIINDTGTGKEVYQVTGIMKDVPSNTHLPVNMLTSFSGPEERVGWAYTYLLLQPRVDYKQVQKKVNQYVNRKGGEDAAIASFPLQPIESIYLNSSLAREIQPNSSKSRVLLIGIAGLIFAL
jgi:putative ABC transport system permease protein